ncbi:MAG: hypothetical protein L6R39_004452 [Caloplaca ligustica]|nr:MAG: hypothetical protein L6R39_004452 [Caloplaca ligustica]
MSAGKRMAVVGLFVLGSFVCIAGIVRIPLLAELKLSDITWTSISVGVWIDVECNIGIVSACLPILRPLFSTKYPASPVSCLDRLLRTVTGSSALSSRNALSSSDLEKGAVSEPSSDATAGEGLRWPSDGTAKGWRWARNNSDGTAVVACPRPQPAPGGRQTEKERERRYRSWFSAAADIVPEIDFANRRPTRPAIDTAQIPRYRDDVLHAEEKPLPPPPLSPTEHERRQSAWGEDKAETPKRRHSDVLHTPTETKASSQRSSWGLRRDTWDLMPSVVYWDKGDLVSGMDLR